MTELKTLIKENASLIRELKYNVKEKQRVIEMLLEQLSKQEEKVFELVEVLKKLIPITWNDGPLAKAYESIGKQAEEILAKVEGKE